MPRSTRTIALLAVGALLLGCAGTTTGELSVSEARSRMSPMLVGVAAAFLDITNDTDRDDVLLAAQVAPDIAARVELHETFSLDDDEPHARMDDDTDDPHGGMGEDHGSTDGGMAPTPEGFAMMGMREVARIAVPAGSTVSLAPGGLHIMLIDLATDLQPGDRFELTLVFEAAGERSVTVEVREQV